MDVRREDIEALDAKISRLKMEYEQYFARTLKREPVKLRDEINRTILNYTNQRITNTALKFRFQNIVSRYNTFKQYWNRVLRAMEEGTYHRTAEVSHVQAPNDGVTTGPSAEEGGASRSEQSGNGNMERLYREFIEARKRCHEPVEGLSIEALRKTVENQKKKIEMRYGARELDYRVYIKDGKAKIAIKPKK